MDDPSLTPSARVLADMAANEEPFFRTTMNLAEAHQESFRAAPLSAEEKSRFDHSVAASLTRKEEIEAADTIDFATYLDRYLALP